MTLSVIVTSCNSLDLLERCLESLDSQREAEEIVVADCSTSDPTDAIRRRFPRVRVVRLARMSVPDMRWRARCHTSGDIVAATEARCTPARDWCRTLVDAHRGAPESPAVGGPVDLRGGASRFDWGLYLSEYAAFAPPATEGLAFRLSSANLSYKREALENARDLLDAGVWEAALHERWVRDGRTLRMSSAAVTFQNGMSTADALRMRFHYARAYAGERFQHDFVRRIAFASGAPLLPILSTWRVARDAEAKGLTREFRRAFGWIAAFNIAWAAGEFVGYLAGRPREPRIF